MKVNRYNPNESREPYRTVRFTVADDDLQSLIRSVEGRSGRDASEIAFDGFVNELHENYSQYLE